MIDESEMSNPTPAFIAIENNSGLSVPVGNMSTTPPGFNNVTENDVLESVWLRGIVIPFYVIVFILGVSGNTMVVYVVARKKSMQTITNIFITNLAISDIMMCLMAVPFTPIAAFIGDWIFGDGLCHILPMILAVSVFVSTLTSTAIAIDRYFVIVYPFKPRMKIWICVLLILFIWIISISISMPLAIYNRVEYDDEKNNHYCGEKWPDHQSRRFFTYTIFILQYVAPCTVITYCYSEVSRVLKERSQAKIGSGNKSREKEVLEIKRKRRTNKMLIAMVSIFMVCWMPLNVSHICEENIPSARSWYWQGLIFFISHIIAMSSTIYNPFLYAWMNENFRKEFKTILPCLYVLRTRSNINGSTNYSTVDTAVTAVDRSPRRERNGSNGGSGKSAHAHYDIDSEKVHLKVATDSEDV